jgi:hypothetical protein
MLTTVIPSGYWKKTFSLCDQFGDKLLVLETSAENTVLVAGSITGVAFELFRNQGTSLNDLINGR